MIFQESIPMHPDDGKCNLYVHVSLTAPEKDPSPIIACLRDKLHATPICPTSCYIKAEHLWGKNNLDSFVEEFTAFLAPDLGLKDDDYDLVVCPVRDILYLRADGTEIEEVE